MKPYKLALITMLIAAPSFGQEKRNLTVSLSTGKFTSPYYPRAVAEDFYNLDLDYYLTGRQILSSGFLGGRHRYYDEGSPNNYTVSKGDTTNVNITYHVFSVLYKYRFINTKAFSVAVGTGAGLMIHTRQYFFTSSTFTFPIDATWTDLVFPVQMEADYKLSQRFRLGITGGFFIHPDYPVLGYHAGLRLGYVIK